MGQHKVRGVRGLVVGGAGSADESDTGNDARTTEVGYGDEGGA